MFRISNDRELIGADAAFRIGDKISVVPIRIEECQEGLIREMARITNVMKIANADADVLLMDKKPKGVRERAIDFECDLRFTVTYSNSALRIHLKALFINTIIRITV